MTDYEAAFEDVMRYLPATTQEVDSQTKLKRFLRENDNQNRMSNKFIDKVTETRTAQELIENNITVEDVKKRSQENKARETQERSTLQGKGHKITTTYTDKKRIRHSVFNNSLNQPVYVDNKNRLRKADGSGQFAKK